VSRRFLVLRRVRQIIIIIIIIIIIMLTFIMRLLLQNKNIGAIQKYKKW